MQVAELCKSVRYHLSERSITEKHRVVLDEEELWYAETLRHFASLERESLLGCYDCILARLGIG